MFEKDKYTESLLDEALKMQPSYSLPKDFASKMAIKVGRKMVLQQYLKEFFIYFLAIIGIAGTSVATLLYVNSDTLQNWLSIAKSNLISVSGIAFIALFILFVDKVLLPYFHYTTKRAF